MQKIVFLTYSDGKHYKLSQKHLTYLAKDCGFFDIVYSFKKSDIESNFLNKYSYSMSQPRSAGHCIWKVYFISKVLDNLEDNDIAIYLDAGSTLNFRGKDRFLEYIELINSSDFGNLMFEHPEGHIEKYWTTKRLFQYFNINEKSEITNSNQLIGGHLIFQKTEHTKKLLNEFYKLINFDEKLITYYYNSEENYEGFIENRHDQSIWSLLSKVYGGVVVGNEHNFRHRENQQYSFPFLSTKHSSQNLLFEFIFKLFNKKAISHPRYFVPIKDNNLTKFYKKYFYFFKSANNYL